MNTENYRYALAIIVASRKARKLEIKLRKRKYAEQEWNNIQDDTEGNMD